MASKEGRIKGIVDFCHKNKIMKYKDSEVELNFHESAFVEDVNMDDLVNKREEQADERKPRRTEKFRKSV